MVVQLVSSPQLRRRRILDDVIIICMSSNTTAASQHQSRTFCLRNNRHMFCLQRVPTVSGVYSPIVAAFSDIAVLSEVNVIRVIALEGIEEPHHIKLQDIRLIRT
jgi:hypothetical protein